MAEEEFPESLKMLASEEGQLNAVYACYGAAAQQGQEFERALAHFLSVYNRIRNQSFTLQDFEEVEGKYRKKTMGALLKEFNGFVEISDDTIPDRMDVALKSRNFLIHDFFHERAEKFKDEKGRMEMMGELVLIGDELRAMGIIARAMHFAMYRVLNIPDDLITPSS